MSTGREEEEQQENFHWEQDKKKRLRAGILMTIPHSPF
jgi:hypothetical protein